MLQLVVLQSSVFTNAYVFCNSTSVLFSFHFTLSDKAKSSFLFHTMPYSNGRAEREAKRLLIPTQGLIIDHAISLKD